MTNQFSPDDERTGHARLLNNIRAEQIKNQPEPNHEPTCESIELMTFGSLTPVQTIEQWCCDWHRHHAQETP